MIYWHLITILGYICSHFKIMNILYVRTSTLTQNPDRQKINEKEFDKIIVDQISGTIPFFDRNGGKQIHKYIDEKNIDSLSVHEIDRLGRNLRDILNTIYYFTERKIPIIFLNQGLRTIDKNGKENSITKLIISILAIVAEMEKNISKERQLEGIAIAKIKGKYLGRKSGSNEDVLKFLSKTKNQKALGYLKKGYSSVEISKIVGVHLNTITKIKKLGIFQAMTVKQIDS